MLEREVWEKAALEAIDDNTGRERTRLLKQN